MNKQEVLNEVLYLSKDARLHSFRVKDIINALMSDEVVVLRSSDTLDTDVPVRPSYINKVNERMICINYGIQKSFPVATITAWNAKSIDACSNPF